MKKFFGRIGEFLKKNYWISPLLLVAVVFILVFTIPGMQSVIEDIGDCFSSDSICGKCSRVTVNKTEDAIASMSDGSVVYVYYYNDEDAGYKTANAALNAAIPAYNKDHKDAQITVYAVNIGYDEDDVNAIGEITKYDDAKLTTTKLDEISTKVLAYLADVQPSSHKISDDYTITSPILVRYVFEGDKVVVDNILYSIDTSSVFNLSTLSQFFAGNYEGNIE